MTNSTQFHLRKNTDAPLIKAMIDKTTKAQEGTRLRFKLLDDVAINNTLLKKGTYLYGLVTGVWSATCACTKLQVYSLEVNL